MALFCNVLLADVKPFSHHKLRTCSRCTNISRCRPFNSAAEIASDVLIDVVKYHSCTNIIETPLIANSRPLNRDQQRNQQRDCLTDEISGFYSRAIYSTQHRWETGGKTAVKMNGPIQKQHLKHYKNICKFTNFYNLRQPLTMETRSKVTPTEGDSQKK